MQENNTQSFDDLMGKAQECHRQGRYEEALAETRNAYYIAPDGSAEKGRAARDMGALYAKTGRVIEALNSFRTAYSIHDAIVKPMAEPSRDALRERGISAVLLGVHGLRRIMVGGDWSQASEGAQDTIKLIRDGWNDFQKAKAKAPRGISRYIDQYEINAARRVSIAESLLGSRSRGLRIGVMAVGLGLASESRLLDTANPTLNSRQRLRAKAKAVAGGVAAIGVGLAASPKHPQLRGRACRLAKLVI